MTLALLVTFPPEAVFGIGAGQQDSDLARNVLVMALWRDSRRTAIQASGIVLTDISPKRDCSVPKSQCSTALVYRRCQHKGRHNDDNDGSTPPAMQLRV